MSNSLIFIVKKKKKKNLFGWIHISARDKTPQQFTLDRECGQCASVSLSLNGPSNNVFPFRVQKTWEKELNLKHG